MVRITPKVGLIIFLCVILVAALSVVAYWGYSKYQYPYGRTHRCSRCLFMALNAYAREHDGHYPAGEATPEASLSLLYSPDCVTTGWVSAEMLAGRAGSAEVAREILESGGRLGPDTCDWHYVEGLTDGDYPRIAIFWGKSSLGHEGQRLYGGHEVVRLEGSFGVIPAEKWEAFLAEQKELLARREKED